MKNSFCIAATMLIAAVAVTFATQPFPLDKELKSKFSGGDTSVEMVCKVTKSGDIYTYLYSIKNLGNKPIKLSWDVLNKAMHFGQNVEMLFELDPEENQVFVLEHPDSPIVVLGKATAFHLTRRVDYEKMIGNTPDIPKGVKTSMHNKNFFNSSSSSFNTPLPKSYVVEDNGIIKPK